MREGFMILLIVVYEQLKNLGLSARVERCHIDTVSDVQIY
jgi:hypothetical protein